MTSLAPAAADGTALDPLALAARGASVLHASAVLAAGRVVALAGPSGAGKSTLAAAWCERDPEVALFADDALAFEPRGECCDAVRIEEPEAPPGAARAPRAPLAAIVFLAREDGDRPVAAPRVETVAAGEAFVALLAEAYCAALDPTTLRRLAAANLDLLSGVPIYRLRYASGRDRLPEALAALAAPAGFIPRAT